LAPAHPAEPPVALQAEAFVELQVSVVEPPMPTVADAADSVAVGATATVAVAAGLVPPAPEQVRENAVVAVSAPVLWLPLAALAPAQPADPPAAVQAVAFVEFQVSVVDPPEATVAAVAVNVAVGTGATVTVAVAAGLVPPAPVQVKEYVVVAVTAPVLWLPFADSEPLQPPDAVHAVALVELHVKVVDPPDATVVAAAARDAVGTGFVSPELPEPPPQAVKDARVPSTSIRAKIERFKMLRLPGYPMPPELYLARLLMRSNQSAAWRPICLKRVTLHRFTH
jgi:hypothetical protein